MRSRVDVRAIPATVTWLARRSLKLLLVVLLYAVITAGPGFIVVSILPDHAKALERYEERDFQRAEAIRLTWELPASGGAVCRDGWVSESSGRGTCSWHGGVSMWAHEVKELAASPPPTPPRNWGDKRVYLVAVSLLWLAGLGAFIRAQM